MCFEIDPGRKTYKTTVYKRLEVTNKGGLKSPVYGTAYRWALGKTRTVRPGLSATLYGQAEHGLYAYLTYNAARSHSSSDEVIVECKVDPKDLLYVSKGTFEATYSRITPEKIVYTGTVAKLNLKQKPTKKTK